jgi:hypothetical protein
MNDSVFHFLDDSTYNWHQESETLRLFSWSIYIHVDTRILTEDKRFFVSAGCHDSYNSYHNNNL